jgi:hypothetical protein
MKGKSQMAMIIIKDKCKMVLFKMQEKRNITIIKMVVKSKRGMTIQLK